VQRECWRCNHRSFVGEYPDTVHKPSIYPRK
jgi:hypothetical protein